MNPEHNRLHLCDSWKHIFMPSRARQFEISIKLVEHMNLGTELGIPSRDLQQDPSSQVETIISTCRIQMGQQSSGEKNKPHNANAFTVLLAAASKKQDYLMHIFCTHPP